MIGKLKGLIDEIAEDHALIDVGGVGYIAFCSSRTLATLAPGEAAELIIETHVREDHISLFGFANANEREWFRLLTSVQGVGNKTALAILSAYAASQLAHHIVAKDIHAFKAISGIGPKLAERIVTELKDKVGKVATGPVMIAAASPAAKGKNKKPAAVDGNITEDAISALVHLGYTRSEAYTAAVRAGQEIGEDAAVDTLIKRSLKELAR